MSKLNSDLFFGRAAPQIPVTQIERAVAFYVGVLGMSKTFENGTPVGFVIVRRNDCELHLTLAPDHKSNSRNVAHILISDARALHDHCVESGVKIVKGLRDQPYKLRDFIIADPDGNRLDIGQPID